MGLSASAGDSIPQGTAIAKEAAATGQTIRWPEIAVEEFEIDLTYAVEACDFAAACWIDFTMFT